MDDIISKADNKYIDSVNVTMSAEDNKVKNGEIDSYISLGLWR